MTSHFPVRLGDRTFRTARSLACDMRKRAIAGTVDHPGQVYPADHYGPFRAPEQQLAIQQALRLLLLDGEPEVVRIVLHLALGPDVEDTLIGRLEGSLAPPVPESMRGEVASHVASWAPTRPDLRERALAVFRRDGFHACAARVVLASGTPRERVSVLALAAAAKQLNAYLAEWAGKELARTSGPDPLLAVAGSLFTQSESIRRAFREGAIKTDPAWRDRLDLVQALHLDSMNEVKGAKEVKAVNEVRVVKEVKAGAGMPPLNPLDRDRWIELLRHDPARFTAERCALPRGSRPDLRGADLRGVDMSTVNLTSCDLTDADLTGAVSPRVGLPSCRLVGTRLDGIRWGSVRDQEAVRQIRLLLESPEAFNDDRKAVESVSLGMVDLSGVVLGAVDLRDMYLLLANLEGADLRRCRMRGAVLTGARLRGAKLAGMQLDRVRFDEADLSDADLSGCRLEDSDLLGAVAHSTSFVGTMWDGSRISRMSGVSSDWSGASLKDVRAMEANLGFARFGRASLVGCDFAFATLADADFGGATLNACDFMDADVARANFGGASLIGTDLHAATNGAEALGVG